MLNYNLWYYWWKPHLNFKILAPFLNLWLSFLCIDVSFVLGKIDSNDATLCFSWHPLQNAIFTFNLELWKGGNLYQTLPLPDLDFMILDLFPGSGDICQIFPLVNPRIFFCHFSWSNNYKKTGVLTPSFTLSHYTSFYYWYLSLVLQPNTINNARDVYNLDKTESYRLPLFQSWSSPAVAF